ncbi:MAG: AIR synthase-related protein, partial [Candidatus Hermodarchaeota archaeon]|nr:AIR synthase-related protein [Candidatus Hermodarchaeota archaeon]
VHETTRKICRLLDINPLNLIASGAMLIATKIDKAEETVKALEAKGIAASIIGKLVEDSSTRNIVESDGSEVPLSQPVEDALWDALLKPISKE